MTVGSANGAVVAETRVGRPGVAVPLVGDGMLAPELSTGISVKREGCAVSAGCLELLQATKKKPTSAIDMTCLERG